MNREKIVNAMTSAMNHLKDSLKLLSSGKEEEISNMVWQASSDVEYCLFLLSLLHPNQGESLPPKTLSSPKLKETESVISCALEMLKKAKSSLEKDDLATAQEKAWQARSYLLKAQEIFEKKRKIGAEKSSTTRS
jgi:hypothetical protein